MSTKDTIAKVYEEFGKRELEVVLLFPTRTGLEKVFLMRHAVLQLIFFLPVFMITPIKKGNENKKIVETRLISADESFETKTSLQAFNEIWDFRFWPSRIPKLLRWRCAGFCA